MASGDVIQELNNAQVTDVREDYESPQYVQRTTLNSGGSTLVLTVYKGTTPAQNPFDATKHYDIVIKEH